jgi:hypothetical protein
LLAVVGLFLGGWGRVKMCDTFWGGCNPNLNLGKQGLRKFFALSFQRLGNVSIMRVKKYDCYLHCSDHQEVGKVDPNRQFKDLEKVCDMTNKINNNGRQAVC